VKELQTATNDTNHTGLVKAKVMRPNPKVKILLKSNKLFFKFTI